MKLASTILAAATLLLAAASPASAADDDPVVKRTYTATFDLRFDFHEFCCSGSVDHVVRFRARGKVEGLVIDSNGRVHSGGRMSYDNRLSDFSGWRKQCCLPDGQMIEDCTLTDGEGGQVEWRNPTSGRGRQHTIFLIPLRHFIGDYDCGMSMKFLRRTFTDGSGTYKGLMRLPLTPPPGDEAGATVTRNVHVTVSDHECPIEDYLATFSCQATMKGKVELRDVDDGLALAPLTPINPKKKLGVEMKAPKLGKGGESVEIRGMSSKKTGTMRMMVFPEPGAKGSPKPKKPRARASQGEEPVAQFVEVLMPEGAPRDVEIPLDDQAQQAIERAGGLRIQFDWLPAGGKPKRANVVIAV